MGIRRFSALLGILAIAGVEASLAEDVLAPGQVWSYHARAGESASTATILKIEPHPVLGRVVHIHVTGLRLKAPSAPGGYTDTIGHMPYSDDALRKSLVKLVGNTEHLPAFEEGYDVWRSAYDVGQAGIFTAPLKEAVEFVEQTLSGK